VLQRAQESSCGEELCERCKGIDEFEKIYRGRREPGRRATEKERERSVGAKFEGWATKVTQQSSRWGMVNEMESLRNNLETKMGFCKHTPRAESAGLGVNLCMDICVRGGDNRNRTWTHRLVTMRHQRPQMVTVSLLQIAGVQDHELANQIPVFD
jgi:hypothetical protein